jgi:isoleucyl-tRNA synthetase
VAKKFTEVLKNIEKEVAKFWEENKIDEKAKNKGEKLFILLDGPPYPNEKPHVGHLRNMTIKDFVVRYKILKNYKVLARAGYDTHGLPIEVMVQKMLGLNTKEDIEKFGKENFIKECENYMKSHTYIWNNVRKKLGMWFNLDAYFTCDKEYISFSWAFFKKAYEKGILKKMYRTVAWCPKCQTPLSDYEVKDKYEILEDPSIYVKFKVRDKENEYLIIWTTTPWTLLANLLIAVNPNYDYCKVKVIWNGKEEYWYLAKSSVEKLMNKFGIEEWEIVEEFKGKDLEGIKYQHVFPETEEKYGEYLQVVCADFVTLGESLDEARLESKKGKHYEVSGIETRKELGTGLVHCAPGHGIEDFHLGLEKGVPIYSPLDEKGNLTEGPFKGYYFKEANPRVIEYLREKGVLIYAETIKHKYPLCWRCKTPITWRASEQIWIERTKYKDLMLQLLEKVKWSPDFGKLNLKHIIETMPDWCISRTRYWGIPIPLWECECGKIKVFGSLEELEKEIGKKIEDPHLPEIEKIEIHCECGRKMKHCGFICDVWFDSGCASFASHYKEGCKTLEETREYYPCDFIVEGIDQFRGWFQSLFVVGTIVFEEIPYKQLSYTGFILDEKGEKMSKSLGNVVWAEDALEKWGATLYRYFILSKKPIYEEMNFTLEQEKKELYRIFNILLNILNLIENPKADFEIRDLEDKWIINKLYKLFKILEEKAENIELHEYCKLLTDFIIEDFSRTYIKIAKEKPNKQGIIKYVLEKCLVLLSPIVPHFSEYLYLKLNNESLFLKEKWLEEKYDEKVIEEFEKVIKVTEEVLSLRNQHKIPLRQPIKSITIDFSPTKEQEELLKLLCNCKEVKTGDKIEINTELTQELLEEGFIRTLSRHIQQKRKEKGLTKDQKVKLYVECDENVKSLIEKYKEYLEEKTNCEIEFSKGEEEINVKCLLGEFKIKIKFIYS